MIGLVVDITHGGLIIGQELQKRDIFEKIIVWDIYNTCTYEQSQTIDKLGIGLIDINIDEVLNADIKCKDDLIDFILLNDGMGINDDVSIISPIHCPIKNFDYSHHAIISLILNDYDKFVIEVTGVKGKTSTVNMISDIFAFRKPLVLNSLGVYIGSEKIVEEAISITSASILESINISNDYDYNLGIFEISLGGTGVADIGVLTNVIEDYSIARSMRKASDAKKQIFNSKFVCCDYNTFFKYYSNVKHENLNLFSSSFDIDKDKCNVYLKKKKLCFEETEIDIVVDGLKTINNDYIDELFKVKTFAPSEYQISNVIASVCCSLTGEIDVNTIKSRLNEYKGLSGRSSIKKIGKSIILEEINPGLNNSVIKNGLGMLFELKNSCLIIGGEYGITCEEINENVTVNLIKSSINKDNKLKDCIILTDKLGESINKKLDYKLKYREKADNAIELAVEYDFEHVIFIYRSKYSNIEYR